MNSKIPYFSLPHVSMEKSEGIFRCTIQKRRGYLTNSVTWLYPHPNLRSHQGWAHVEQCCRKVSTCWDFLQRFLRVHSQRLRLNFEASKNPIHGGEFDEKSTHSIYRYPYTQCQMETKALFSSQHLKWMHNMCTKYVQGPPYILARHVMAIFSISAENFQNIFFTKQGSRGSECLYLMVFWICLS